MVIITWSHVGTPKLNSGNILKSSCSGIHNAFIIVTIKNHPFIKTMLDHIVHNISIKYYGLNAVDITGPTALSTALNNFLGYNFITESNNEGIFTINN